MKKLILASIVMLATLTACQNETSNVEEIQTLKIEKASKAAENLVKSRTGTKSARIDVDTDPTNPTDAVIDCHTPWGDIWGHACVWSKGFLFKVEWETIGTVEGGNIKWEKVYSTKQVSFCSC